MYAFVLWNVSAICAAYLFLSIILRLTQDAKEPPALQCLIPFISPLIGMARKRSMFYVLQRDKYNIPIYTLRLPFLHVYVVNATTLIPNLQKQWRTVSFAPLVAASGPWLMGMSDEAGSILQKDIDCDENYVSGFSRATSSVLAPGYAVDTISREAVEVVTEAMDNLAAHVQTSKDGQEIIDLWAWTHREMLMATTDAVYGPGNPYKDKVLEKAWNEFERSYLTLGLSPFKAFLAPTALRNRELIAAAWTKYIQQGLHQQASEFAKAMHAYDRSHGLQTEDLARTEIGHSFAMLGSTAPAAWWMMYHIFSDPMVLADVREELEALAGRGGLGGENGSDDVETWTIDMANIRTKCPILLSVFKETLRHRSLGVQVRLCLEDQLIDNYLLKKGGIVIIPQNVQHTSEEAWGADAHIFDHLRFVDSKTKSGFRKINHTAFRAFGGGHTMCPGRHLSSTQIMAFAALMVLRFDVNPVDSGNGIARWKEPTWNNTPAVATFPVPDVAFRVSVRPRDNKKWILRFETEVSEGRPGMLITAEDCRGR